MTDRHALARALRHRGGQLIALLPKRSQDDGQLMLQAADALSEPAALTVQQVAGMSDVEAVLSEPAAEADCFIVEGGVSGLIDANSALRAQLAVAKEDAASWRRVAEGLQTQLAAAAPLFEAAHACERYVRIGSVAKGNELLGAAEAWARSPEGQAWLATHRAERSGG